MTIENSSKFRGLCDSDRSGRETTTNGTDIAQRQTRYVLQKINVVVKKKKVACSDNVRHLRLRCEKMARPNESRL